MLAAKVSAYSLQARSKHSDEFEVRFLLLEATPHLYPGREGRRYLWSGRICTWRNRDLQSFAPLRMMVPEVMGFEGRALLLDPDVFAIGDVHELLHRDMNGKAIVCRSRPSGFYSTSVMLLDCAQLTHWQWNRDLDATFALQRDMYKWLCLVGENPDLIGPLEENWNDFDKLDGSTLLLHNTERLTQPWKTGLPVNFDLDLIGSYPYRAGFHARDFARRVRQRFVPLRMPEVRCQPHPDPAQVRFFVALLREAIEHGAVSKEFVSEEIRLGHVRPDLLELLENMGR